jgi:hypothetical protein
MLQLLSAFAVAASPTPIEPSMLPEFPERLSERIQAECLVEMISNSDGRHQVFGVTGCEEAYASAVRDRLSWMTWRTPPPTDDEPLQSTYALLTGVAGVPGGLYVRMGVRFERKPGEEPVVSLVSTPILSPKKGAGEVRVPSSMQADVGRECVLLVHVDESGRTERVQAQTCSERVRAAVELPLMAWTWHPLLVDGRPRAFAATFRFTVDHLMELDAD